MGRKYDEPKYVDVKKSVHNKEVIGKFLSLCRDQSFAVLATQGNNECYTSLISFKESDDLSKIAFATPTNTKKFNFLKQNENVSILIDNRSRNPESINNITALTAIGKVKILSAEDDIDFWSKALIDKHNYLENFIKAETTAIVVVDICKYNYVSSFQEVIEWKPV
ncbi:pyridoxamine 5'-phosphate oxidase family protein [Senegalia sp. (in: firmicutes)]|uniref:pyridoxamine 5'-phosphate oxidase family protein n=1 Tax=Senegalia sp. (in: firmicutes) TaxID=1924098 RepID=UPI003F98737D